MKLLERNGDCLTFDNGFTAHTDRVMVKLPVSERVSDIRVKEDTAATLRLQRGLDDYVGSDFDILSLMKTACRVKSKETGKTFCLVKWQR